MTIYEGRDRQGLKHFKRKPSFAAMFDVLEGERCRKPRKGDRVIRRFVVVVTGSGKLLNYYPEKYKIRPLGA